MTYVEWGRDAKIILEQADAHNEFVKKAKQQLLTDIGPRIAKLGQSGYTGCGFHYHMEQTFGDLVKAMALPWQPCASHLDKVEDDSVNAILTEVLFEGLVADVVKAEATVQQTSQETARVEAT